MTTAIETPPTTAAPSAQEAAVAGDRKYMKKKTLRRRVVARCTLFSILLITLAFAQVRAMAADLAGTVQGAGLPIAGSTVTLYAASTGSPTKLVQGKTDENGAFDLDVDQAPADSVLYLVAKGGTPKAAADRGPNDAIALMAVLGTQLPKAVTVNELTTVASAFTAARFIEGESISGNPLGLRIAARNVPNLVDPETGGWGKALLDPINSAENTTLANLNTLGSLISAFFTVANDDWRARFLKAATPLSGVTPKNTLEAMAGIARAPWAEPKALYALFDEVYPQPKDGSRRNAPFVPYLAFAPSDFALMLRFTGGGAAAPGKFVFDAEGNLWSGQNWMPGSQSGNLHNIGGGLIKFTSDGIPLSPPITGFRGMGVDGVGWGTAVTLDKVWVTGLNGAILVTDFNGRPIGKESDFPFAGKVGGLQGVGLAANGDVWIADATKNQLLYFPGGRVKEARLVQVVGLKSPFAIVIDKQNRVWVSNAQSDTVLRFPADDPSKVESFRAGIGVRGMALDSKDNLWVASNMSLDFPPPVIPDGVSVMEQFQLAGQHIAKELASGKTTGVVNMFRPDSTQLTPTGFTGNGLLNVPWGVSIDGKDDVWVANFWGRGVVLMAGADPTTGYSAGTKPGDVIHQFQSGSIQMLTDVVIDPAGNVWAADNWNNLNALLADPPSMTTTRRQNLIALACALALTNAHSKGFSPEELQRRMLERRAVDAAIWGAPQASERSSLILRSGRNSSRRSRQIE